MARMVPVLRTRPTLPTERRADPSRNTWRDVQTCLAIMWVLIGLAILSIGIYMKFYADIFVVEAAEEDSVKELRPVATALSEGSLSGSGGDGAQQVLNATNEVNSAQADLAGPVIPGDIIPGAAVQPDPAGMPDASMVVQNALQPDNNPQEPTKEPGPVKKDDGKHEVNVKTPIDGKDKTIDANKDANINDKNKKDNSKPAKDEGKDKKDDGKSKKDDGKSKQDLPKSSKDNKDIKGEKKPDVAKPMTRAERHEMAEARRKANAKRRAKMHKRRSGGRRRR